MQELLVEDVEHDPRYPYQQLVIYHDLEHSGGFPRLYQSGLSCKAKVAESPQSNSTFSLESYTKDGINLNFSFTAATNYCGVFTFLK